MDIQSERLPTKQFINIHDIKSRILEILSGVSWGSILGQILFNILIDFFLYHIQSTNTHNYADYDLLLAAADNVAVVIKTLEEADEALSWINCNFVFANFEKSLAITPKNYNKYTKDIKIK